ncbi:MAG: TonB-dependent receptor [Burkholderiales bacterium]|nr:MAG: TonB-dependent receptor [Burkholderiales bacterium]
MPGFRGYLAAVLGAFGMFPAVAAAQALAEVVVTASRLETPLGQTLSDVTVIDRARIERAGDATVAQLLRSAAGIEISENGGAGKFTGLFLRGTKTAQTVILVDGVRLENPLSGGANLEFLPLAAIDRIEVVKGPVSSLYGSGGVGGVIQIFTRRGAGAIRPFGSAAFGTYSTWELRGGLQAGTPDFAFSAVASAEGTEGFDATRPRSAERQADADGNRRRSATVSVSRRVGASAELGLTALAAEGSARYDSAFSAPDETRYEYRSSSWSLYLRSQPRAGWKSTARIGRSEIGYDFEPFVYAPRMHAHHAVWENEFRLGPGRLLAGLDWLQQRVRGPGVGYIVEGVPRARLSRLTRSAFVGYDLVGRRHSLRVHLRHDDIEAVGERLSGSVAYGYRLGDGWQLRGSIGSAFRAPTFDDLFSPFGANPGLRAERAVGAEVALERELLASRFRATVFANRIDDAIELDSAFIPQNLARATVRGLSIEGERRIGAWLLDARATWQDPRGERSDAAAPGGGTPLARRARARAELGVSYRAAGWSVGAELLAQSRRVDADGSSMGGYAVIDLRAARGIGRDTELFARLGNLTGKAYETAAGYASAGRTLFVGIRHAPR